MKMRGFTIIETMIVIAILGILSAVIAPVIFGTNTTQPISTGINGTVEERCMGGLKFIIDRSGRATQIMDTLGHGVACTSQTASTMARPQ